MKSENNKIATERKNLLKGYNMLLYFAGSMIMNEPTEECVIDFWAKGTLKKLPVSSLNPRFIEAAALLRDSCDDKDSCRKKLSEDFFRLFAVSGLPLAPAYASIYLAHGNDNGSPREKISEFYHSYGWESRSQGKVPEDHLGIELLFLTMMIDKYMHLDDDPFYSEMRKEIRTFIDLHILSWIPEWNEDIREHAHTYCYKGIATLIYACVEDIYNLFASREDELTTT